MKHPHCGHPISEETRRKISVSKKGKTWTLEQRLARSDQNHPFWGKHHSDETKQKMSKRWQGTRFGKDNPMYGRHLSDEARKKISAALSGPNGPRYGYRFVYLQPNIYRQEHRIIAEKALGRPLKKTEHVHHINNDKKDNRNENLLVCTNKYHTWLHRKIETLTKRRVFNGHLTPPGTI